MNTQLQDFAHRTAVEVYGAFLNECVIPKVRADRVGTPPKASATKIDGRPVRLVTISGKGGWSKEAALAERWARNDNVSLLDHLLSVARGALMFWLADAPRSWFSEAELAETEWLAYALVCVAFLHDIDKDLELRRGEKIPVSGVAERMERYGINEFLKQYRHYVSPAAMLNYIEEVEGTQTARSPAAPDYDRRIATACRYVELADKLEGIFTSRESGAGGDGVIASLNDANRWPVLQDRKQWDKIEIHDHLHVFLLDHFQKALSAACKDVAGQLPLIEIVHDGRLLCVIPKTQANRIREQAIDRFLDELPYGLGFSINNRLACEFVGGAASWPSCRNVMKPKGNWRPFINLFALPKSLAHAHSREIDELFQAAGMETSWGSFDAGAVGATVKPALDHPGGDAADLDMEPAHALAFLAIVLNHVDVNRKGAAPNGDDREQELLNLMQTRGRTPPPVIAAAPAKDGRTRRVLVALWTIAEVWRLAEEDRDEAQSLLDQIAGRHGLIGLWLEGNDTRAGLKEQIEDVSSDIVSALRQRFSAYLTGNPAQPFDGDTSSKRCILCNEPVRAGRMVNTASRAHGIKASAFSGRDGRNDHLASPSGDTHLCPVCLAELQLRQKAQEAFKGSGDLPPLFSSPTTTGLFGGLAFQREDAEASLGLNDLNRLDGKKGTVYEGLDCQTRRIRVARLETLPTKDKELVTRLRMTLKAIQRLGRPIHIFRGAPSHHPAIFYSDALPDWLEHLLDGNSLRIEQIPDVLSRLELFENMAEANGLGIEWAKRLAEPDPTVRLGTLCVAWAMAVDQRDGDKKHAGSPIETKAREEALKVLKQAPLSIRGDVNMTVYVKDNQDPLVRLAWLATRVQKRIGIGASANKQLLCWKIALDFYPAAQQSITEDQTALILGLAGRLEEELARKDDAAAKKHRDGQSLDQACVEFATHFADEVWAKVFQFKEPTSQIQRMTAAIYRFALLEAYRERGISEAEDGASSDDDTQEF